MFTYSRNWIDKCIVATVDLVYQPFDYTFLQVSSYIYKNYVVTYFISCLKQHLLALLFAYEYRCSPV